MKVYQEYILMNQIQSLVFMKFIFLFLKYATILVNLVLMPLHQGASNVWKKTNGQTVEFVKTVGQIVTVNVVISAQNVM